MDGTHDTPIGRLFLLGVISMADTQHVYDDEFFDYISEGSGKSADAVSKILEPLFQSGGASILDVGCGQGVWTRRFSQIPGVDQAVGIDGAYVNPDQLVISAADFVAHDLTTPLDLERKFTLSVSLEVGEHLPPDTGPVLVDTLTKHADIVLFSAAIVGQGGEHHVNERPLEYWRGLFAERGYVPLDVIRPKLVGKTEVEPWYRYNSILYVAKTALGDLPAGLASDPVPEGQKLAQFASPLWRLRCAILGLLPRSAVDRLALMKHNWVRRSRARRTA